jgi:hypothetical protein
MRPLTSLLLVIPVLLTLGTAQSSLAYYETGSFNLERAEIRGYVTSVQNQVAYIQTYNGDEFAVQLGPESYWNAHDYYLPEAVYVKMDVWYDPTDRYTDWYFAGEIWGPDFHFVLTNDEGVPFWVIDADDYYYSLGYRASCVSYMLWYDCPPVYFVYLILPPPPPLDYVCYYGPHWRTHHHDWHHGSRYGSGGSYWHDGQGQKRSGNRGHDLVGNEPRSDVGSVNPVRIAGRDHGAIRPLTSTVRSQPVSPERMLTPVRKPLSQSPATVLPRTNVLPVERPVIPQRMFQPQSPAPVTPRVSPASPPVSTYQPRVFESLSNTQSSSAADKPAVVRQAVRETSAAQVRETSRIPSEKRAVADSPRPDRKLPDRK